MAKKKKQQKHTRKPNRPVKKKQGNRGDQFWKKWNPLAPKTGKEGKRELNAADRLAHESLDRELRREHAGSGERSAAIDRLYQSHQATLSGRQASDTAEQDKWYADYQAKLAQLRGETQGAYDKAAGSIQQFSQQSGAQDTANRQQMTDQARKDAEIRGVEYNPQGAQDATNASNARQNLLNAVHGTVQGQGANQFASMTNRQAIAGTSQRETRDKTSKFYNEASASGLRSHSRDRAEEDIRRRGIDEDLRELARERGDFRVDFLRQLREDERKYSIEKSAAKVDKMGARTDRYKAKETGRANRAGEAQDRREEAGRNRRNTEDERGQDRRNRQDNAQRARDRKADYWENRRDRAQDRRENRKDRRKSGGSGKKKNKF